MSELWQTLGDSQLPVAQLTDVGKRIVLEKLDELALELARADGARRRMEISARSGKLAYQDLHEVIQWVVSIAESYTTIFAVAYPKVFEGTTRGLGDGVTMERDTVLLRVKAGRYKHRGQLKPIPPK